MVIFCYVDLPTMKRKENSLLFLLAAQALLIETKSYGRTADADTGRMNGNDSKYLECDPLQNSAFHTFVGSSEAHPIPLICCCDLVAKSCLTLLKLHGL